MRVGTWEKVGRNESNVNLHPHIYSLAKFPALESERCSRGGKRYNFATWQISQQGHL